MGYKRKAPTYLLVFSDEEMDGLVVRCRAMAIAEVGGYRTPEEVDAMTYKDILDLNVQRLAGEPTDEHPYPPAIIDWNLEDDDGYLLPIEPESLRKQDPKFVMSIARAWGEAVLGIKIPLAERSTSGDGFPEESLAMEPLSPSPTNSNGLSES
jgi:hypothetical protein